MDFVADAAGADEHEPLAALWELVGELHGDAAAEGVPDDGDAVDVEHAQQVTHCVAVCADRVVCARLGIRSRQLSELSPIP
jgi:hypothetical protein